ncbi:MAG: hypothetical protein ACYC3L_13085 [Gemmatimonadaceae bacterium]
MAALIVAAGCATSEPSAPEASAVGRRSVALQASLPTGTVAYNAIPMQLPGNVPSQPFQAQQTAEFGDHVALAGTARQALSATVLMSDWAKHSGFPEMDSAGYTHPITLNIYGVDKSGPVPALGVLLATVTQDMFIPWRPEADPACTDGRWLASDGTCYSGIAFTIAFDLRALALTLPDEFIFGVAYNTNTWGYQPIGQHGPYESLNVGLANVGGVPVPPSVGSDVEATAVFWNTKTAAWYADGGAGGVGIFRRDQDEGWRPYPVGVRFNTFATASTLASCKNGGWRALTRADASVFRNQGDCVSFVASGK